MFYSWAPSLYQVAGGIEVMRAAGAILTEGVRSNMAAQHTTVCPLHLPGKDRITMATVPPLPVPEDTTMAIIIDRSNKPQEPWRRIS